MPGFDKLGNKLDELNGSMRDLRSEFNHSMREMRNEFNHSIRDLRNDMVHSIEAVNNTLTVILPHLYDPFPIVHVHENAVQEEVVVMPVVEEEEVDADDISTVVNGTCLPLPSEVLDMMSTYSMASVVLRDSITDT